jgi:GT2 family glycosyltransferase
VVGVTPSVSVVICAYTEDRWEDLGAAVDSVWAQTAPADEVIVVVDHNAELLTRAARDLPGVRAVANSGRRGLSGARNSGVAAARGSVVAFLDDDATAAPEWLARLLRPYDDDRVAAVGGSVRPRWTAGRPGAFPEEFDWVVGCTYRGLREDAGPVRNVIGANMSFRREVLEAVGGFRDGLGRVGTRPVGCEETELCLRVRRRFPDAVVLYEPRATVSHRVPPERATWRYFRARCYSEGLSKALVARCAGADSALAAERAYVAHALPRGIAADVTRAVRDRDPISLGRAAAVVAGLTITTAGYAAGSAAGRVRDRRVARSGPDAADWLHFDVHGRAGVRVAADAPGAPQLADMLAPFRAERLNRVDLSVGACLEPLTGLAEDDSGARYGGGALALPARRLQVIIEGGAVRLNGRGELLVPLLALLDRIVVGYQAAMVHAAAVARDGRAVCLAGAGGTGKTSAALRMVVRHGDAFMADDWCFLSAQGDILGYAKPLFLRPHHRALLPHLFAHARKPLAPGALAGPLAGLATAVHPAVAARPQIARFARRWSPEHMIVPVGDALPDAEIATAAPLCAAVFVERGAGAGVRLEPRDADWMASRMIGSFHAELPRGARDMLTALAAVGLLSLERYFAEKAAVLARALAGRPAYLLRVPRSLGAEAAADAIAGAVDAVIPSEEAAAPCSTSR